MNIIDFEKLVSSQCFAPCLDEYSGKIELCDYIYHYTSQYTLSEILERNEIWLSHALDMNDPGEIFFGIEVIIDILSTYLSSDSKVLEFVTEESKRLHDFKRFIDLSPIFILSFSEKRDNLKQWIHYANDASGVSFEFIRSKIINEIASANPNDFSALLIPVIYFYKNKKPAGKESTPFIRFVSDFFSKIDQIMGENDFKIDINYKQIAFDYLVIFASFVKQNLYFEEKEWRLILRTGIGCKRINTKVINNVAQMKLVLSVDDKNIINMIHSIMIGPKNYNNLTNKKALELLMLQKLNGCSIHINNSSGEIK